MNKVLSTTIMFVAFCTVVACGSGFVTANTTPIQTYYYTGFIAPVVVQTNCDIRTAPFYTCSKESSSFSYSVAFASSNPASNLQLPPLPLPAGVSMNSTPGCANVSGSNYSCQINLSSSNVESGVSVNVPYTGSLGYQGGFTITYQ